MSRFFFDLSAFKPSSSGLQSLSLFRILFGILLFFDYLLNVAPYLRVFYSDRGLITRAANFEAHSGSSMLSLLNTLDHPWHLAAFSVVYTIAVVCLIIGYRTNLAKWIVFIGCVSLYQRNVMVTAGSDMLVRLFLLWCLFVPLARYWSVDAALNRMPRDIKVPFWLMAGVKSQVSMLYFFSALFKLAGDVWRQGVAPAWAMHDGVHGTPLGAAFADTFPFLMAPMSYGIITFQLIFPLLVYSPVFNDFTRAIALLGAFVMHASFIVLLEVGNFPEVCITYLVLLIPGHWLDALLGRRRQRLEKIEIFYEPGCGFCEKTALIFREFCLSPNSRVQAADADAAVLATLRGNNSWVVRDHAHGKTYLKWEAVAFVLRQSPITWIFGVITSLPLLKQIFASVYVWIGRSRPILGKFTATALPFNEKPYKPTVVAQILCASFIVLAFAGNVLSLPYYEQRRLGPDWLRATIAMLQLHQRWNLFAPSPVHYIYDYKVSGISMSGLEHTLDFPFNDGVIRRGEGRRILFQSHRWLKYFHKMYDDMYVPIGRLALRRVCQAYNRDPAHVSDPLRTATLQMWRLHYEYALAGFPLRREVRIDIECPARPVSVPVERKDEPADQTPG